MARYLFDDPTVGVLPTQGAYTPGTFTNTTVTVNSQGIITDIEDGVGIAAVSFGNLNDVDLTGLVSGQIVRYDGADWVPETLIINALDDVIISGASDGDALRFDGSDWLNVVGVFSADIGVTVQAWDTQLDGLAALDTSTGFVVQTGSATFDKRALDVSTGSGMTLTDGDGVAGDPTFSFDMLTTTLGSTVDPVADFILMHDTSVSLPKHILIQDLVDATVPVTGATNVGMGADFFKANLATVLEFRTISTPSTGLTITNTTDDVIVTLDSDLEDLAGLVPTLDSFIVGNGSGNWSVETPSLARTSLGLGTMATETATDYLLLAGGTMSGTLDMGTNDIINVVNPTNAQDAATKFYVDAEIQAIVAGDGLTRTTTTFNVGQNGDNSILVNADDIQLNTTFTDNLYHTKIELNETTPSAPGADLVGTDTKVGLNNATTVEEALDHIDTELVFAVERFKLELTGTWNLDVGAPNVIIDTVNDVEVARFVAGSDIAIYRDFMLPPDFDATRSLQFSAAFAKETATTGQVDLSLAFQHQRTPGTFIDDVKTFSDNNTDIVIVQWTIASNTFLPLDVVTLRISRQGTNVSDTHTTGVDFFAAYLIQN